MDINGLRYFIKVAETMNFTKAASECAITQTAMSQHIRNMEKSLGFKLFERSTRQVTLTPAGENFYKKAQVIVEEFDEAVSSSKDIVKGKSGSIKVCVASTVEGLMLMPRFAAFKEQNPNISLGLTIITPSQIPREIIKGRCDIAVYCPAEFNSSLLQIRRIADFDYVILCSKQHRFSALERISLKELQKEKILLIRLSGSWHSFYLTVESPCATETFFRKARGFFFAGKRFTVFRYDFIKSFYLPFLRVKTILNIKTAVLLFFS